MVEQIAEAFAKRVPNGGTIKNLSFFTDKMNEELQNFNDKNKILYLRTAINKMKELKIAHEGICTSTPEKCATSQAYSKALFVFNQELDELNQSGSDDREPIDGFKYSEQIDILSKLEELKTKLEEVGLGQEILFNEIDEMKNHFNLNKKNWTELLIGKIRVAAGEKAVSLIIDSGVSEFNKMLE